MHNFPDACALAKNTTGVGVAKGQGASGNEATAGVKKSVSLWFIVYSSSGAVDQLKRVRHGPRQQAHKPLGQFNAAAHPWPFRLKPNR